MSEEARGPCTFCGGDGVVTRSFGINDPGSPAIVPCPYCSPDEPAPSHSEDDLAARVAELEAALEKADELAEVVGKLGATERERSVETPWNAYLDARSEMARASTPPSPTEGARIERAIAELDVILGESKRALPYWARAKVELARAALAPTIEGARGGGVGRQCRNCPDPAKCMGAGVCLSLEWGSE